MFGIIDAVRRLLYRERFTDVAQPHDEGPPVPPWVKYPGNEPWWGGWRQGFSEAWLMEVWLPFWKKLSIEEKEKYLQEWNPPNEDWREYLTVHWK